MMALRLGVQFFFVFGTISRILLDFVIFTIIRFSCTVSDFKSQRFFYGVKSFSEWADVAAKLDVAEGKDIWRQNAASPIYDHVTLLQCFSSLRQALDHSNCREVEFALTTAFDRRHCGIDNPLLHSHCRIGTKQMIEEYLTETENALEFYCKHTCGVHPLREKISFLEHSMYNQGKTALCLSGGGALALIHAGVILTLLDHGLLPNILSGTSGGSIIVALIASRTDEELYDLLKPEMVDKYPPFLPPVHEQIRNFLKKGVLIFEKDFSATMQSYIGNYTFAEAYQRTGRIVNISVSKSDAAGYPILLNHKNSPHILLWSAVTASCALPGLMNPVPLYAKPPHDSEGTAENRLAYPPGFKFMDGSMMADLPVASLRQLFGVNQFIVSQVNPHVVPFSKQKDNSSTLTRRIEIYLLKNMKHRLSRLCEMNLLPLVFGQDIRGIFTQSYSDTTAEMMTIVPDFSLYTSLKFLAQPNQDDIRKYIYLGRIATWPKIPQIYHRMRLEKKLEVAIQKLTKHKHNFQENFEQIQKELKESQSRGVNMRRATSF
eukprot:TRINITY_DN1398_c0_g1_i1.p1 TRINITY_DN1398_c0_g1~~TRINITY_DN1398_c0_g1_i1.p1  ORF type:complete len:546 (+),score=96.06 TRINITY_DN1398_c0_g1_i1:425-2062(+)